MAVNVYNDPAEWAMALLKANQPVLDLVYAGKNGIVLSGELDTSDIEAAERDRMASKENTKVLAMVVIDRGEREQGTIRRVFVDVYVYDRRKGYTNIRAAREAVITALKNRSMTLVRGAHVVQMHYAGRSGHEKFEEFDLDYERIWFDGDLVFSGDPDVYN